MNRNNHYIFNKMQRMYRDFIKGSPRNKITVPHQTLYSTILFKIFRKIFERMMFDAYKYTMENLGTFSIVKFQPEMKILEDGTIVTNKIVNIRATKKAIEETGNRKLRIYYDNEATGGFIFKLIWDTNKYAFINKSFYTFSLCRTLRPMLQKEILADNVIATIVNFKI